MEVKEALKLLKRGTIDLVSEAELEKKLTSGKKLIVKLGCDPTSSDLHFGHSVVLNKLRTFQDLGHTAVLVIGDFTAGVGDPSGRDSTRPMLSREQILKNAKTYTDQAFKVLDPAKTIVRFNSEWLDPFITTKEILATLSKVTMAQVLERDDFKKRMKAGNPISVLEVMYSLFQGQDSVALKADVELGGTDQIFNLLVGRQLQKNNGQEPQVVMTMPLLVGTDGVKKMSKSYGNTIDLGEEPQAVRKKVMSMFTDPNKQKANDPANPDGCTVFAFHKIYNPDFEKRAEECRAGALGCVACKKHLFELMEKEITEFNQRRNFYAKDEALLEKILKRGAEAARESASKTLAEVKKVMKVL